MRIVHIQFMFTVCYQTKIKIFTFVLIIASLFPAVAFTTESNELLTLFGFIIFSMGLHYAGKAFGESVLIGFFKFFPSDTIYLFSSGTGFATISAYILFILLKYFDCLFSGIVNYQFINNRLSKWHYSNQLLIIIIYRAFLD